MTPVEKVIDRLAGLHPQSELVDQQRLVVGVAEADVLESKGLAEAVQTDGLRGIGELNPGRQMFFANDVRFLRRQSKLVGLLCALGVPIIRSR